MSTQTWHIYYLIEGCRNVCKHSLFSKFQWMIQLFRTKVPGLNQDRTEPDWPDCIFALAARRTQSPTRRAQSLWLFMVKSGAWLHQRCIIFSIHLLPRHACFLPVETYSPIFSFSVCVCVWILVSVHPFVSANEPFLMSAQGGLLKEAVLCWFQTHWQRWCAGDGSKIRRS